MPKPTLHHPGKDEEETEEDLWHLTFCDVFEDLQKYALDPSSRLPNGTTCAPPHKTPQTPQLAMQEAHATRSALNCWQMLEERMMACCQQQHEEEEDPADLCQEVVDSFAEELWLVTCRVLVTYHKVPNDLLTLIGMFLAALFVHSKRTVVALRSSAVENSVTVENHLLREQDLVELWDTCITSLHHSLVGNLLAATGASDKWFRGRAVQLLQQMVNRVDELDSSLVTKCRTALLTCCRDKVACVRVQAALGLVRFQQTVAVRNELLRMVASDPSKEVRLTAMQCMQWTLVTLPKLLVRLRDVHEPIRIAAMDQIANQFSLQSLAVAYRVQIVDQSLQDRSPSVQQAGQRLVLNHWLPACEGDPIRLLHALDVEQYPNTASLVAQLVLKARYAQDPFTKPTKPSFMMDTPSEPMLHNSQGARTVMELVQSMNTCAMVVEEVFFWKEQCVFLTSSARAQPATIRKATMSSELLVPDVRDFCDCLRASQQLTPCNGFVLEKLLEVGQFLDFQDEFGKQKMVQTIQQLACDFQVEARLMDKLLALLEAVYGSHEANQQQEFIQIASEIMSEVYDPLEYDQAAGEDVATSSQVPSPKDPLSELQREQAMVRLEYLMQAIEKCDEEADAARYQQMEQEMLELEQTLQDPRIMRWLRCLEILAQLLKRIQPVGGGAGKRVAATKQAFLASVGRFFVPAIEHDVPALREAALECLALYCLLDRDVAERHVQVFWNVLSNDQEEDTIRLLSVRALFDLASCFARLEPARLPRTADTDERDHTLERSRGHDDRVPDQSSLHEMLETLADVYSKKSMQWQLVLVQGFAKLFLLKRVTSPQILSRMLGVYTSLLHQEQVTREREDQLANKRAQSVDAEELNELATLQRDIQSGLASIRMFVTAFVACNAQVPSPKHGSSCELLEQAMVISVLQQVVDAMLQPEQQQVTLVHGHALGSLQQTLVLLNKPGERHSSECIAAHQCRIGIHLCVEWIALLQVFGVDPIKVVQKDLLLPLLKSVEGVWVDVRHSSTSHRSLQLLVFLVERLVEMPAIQSQSMVCRTLTSVMKRFRMARDHHKAQDAPAKEQDERDDFSSNLAQDIAWAEHLVNERQQVLQVCREQVDKQTGAKKPHSRAQSRGAASRRRVRRTQQEESSESSDSASSSSLSDDDNDDDDNDLEDDHEAMKRAPTERPRRTCHARKSKTLANERLVSQDLKLAMDLAMESQSESDMEALSDVDDSDDAGDDGNETEIAGDDSDDSNREQKHLQEQQEPSDDDEDYVKESDSDY